MILETAFIEVLPENHSKFEAAVNRAVVEVLSRAEGFIDFEMHKGIEKPDAYTFDIHWKSLEDHTIGFRQSNLFTEWRAIIGEFFMVPPIVEHWENV